MARPIADYVVSMGVDGQVASHGDIAEALANDQLLAQELSEDQKALDKHDGEVDPPQPGEESKSDGKLIIAEEVEEGHLSWAACALSSSVLLFHR